MNRSKAQVNGTEIMGEVCKSFGKPGQEWPDSTQFDYRHNFASTNMKFLSPQVPAHHRPACETDELKWVPKKTYPELEKYEPPNASASNAHLFRHGMF